MRVTDKRECEGERFRKKKRERGVVGVFLWMWSLKMLKRCVRCEHPSNGKSMMGKALWWSQGCYIKAEVLHQCFSGSRYGCLFGFFGLLNPPPLFYFFHFYYWKCHSFRPCYCVRIYAYRHFFSTTLHIKGTHKRQQFPPVIVALQESGFIFYVNRTFVLFI